MTRQAMRGAAEGPTEKLLANALSSVGSAIFITDHDGRIVWCNDAFARLCGYDAAELLGATPHMLASGRHDRAAYQALWETISSGLVWKGEMIDRRKDGTLYVVDEVIAPLFDTDGRIGHYVAVQNEIDQPREERAREHYLAHHDALTGLGNRAWFISELQSAMDGANLRGGSCAVLYMDLDNFKPVNDNFGHQIGDGVLIAVAQRLRAGVRRQDAVARLGGDEFAVVLPDDLDRRTASTLASKLNALICRPYLIEGVRVHLGLSVGIALYPDDGKTVQTLLDAADSAMYRAKRHGGGLRFAHASRDGPH